MQAKIEGMSPPQLKIIGLTGIPEVQPGDSVAKLIASAMRRLAVGAVTGDVVVVAQKIVSKAEGRIVRLEEVSPSDLARSWARAHGQDPRQTEVVLRESRRIVRMDRGRMIVETAAGFVCANAGVDASNTASDRVTLLPADCDRSAREIQEGLQAEFGVLLAVIVSDTFGRPWRNGLTNVALGVAGMSPLIDYRGEPDDEGKPLRATVIAVADEVASAAELVMGKTRRVPVAIARGVAYRAGAGDSRDLLRKAEDDLFR